MAQDQLSLPLTKDQAFALVDAVTQFEELALSASAHEAENGEWIFEATCDSPPDLAAFNALARQVLGAKVKFRTERLDPDFDWVSKSLEGLKPVIAGGFFVYGSHDDTHIPAGATPLHIEAAQAFGTGHHETTAGCLEAIDRVIKRKKPNYVLDVGTGTGVLAIAIAKRTHLQVIASDIDPIAVNITIENAGLNEVSSKIRAVEATGLKHRVIKHNAPYDLIVANILAAPLAALAPAIAQIAMPGATIILSGILVSQAARVIAAYGQQGIVLQQRITKAEWQTLIFEKPSAVISSQG